MGILSLHTWIDSPSGNATLHSLELSQLPKWMQTSLLQQCKIIQVTLCNIKFIHFQDPQGIPRKAPKLTCSETPHPPLT